MSENVQPQTSDETATGIPPEQTGAARAGGRAGEGVIGEPGTQAQAGGVIDDSLPVEED